MTGSSLAIRVEHATFDEWWEPFTRGVGPAGAYLARVDPTRRAAIRDAARAMAPLDPIAITAVAWAARGSRDRRAGHGTATDRPEVGSTGGRSSGIGGGSIFGCSSVVRSLRFRGRRPVALAFDVHILRAGEALHTSTPVGFRPGRMT